MTNPAIHSLNWVDYSILGIIVFSIIISFFRGFSREAVSLVVWVLGIMVALKFADPTSIFFKTWIASPTLRYIIAFATLFLIIFIVGILLNAAIHALVKKAGLSKVVLVACAWSVDVNNFHYRGLFRNDVTSESYGRAYLGHSDRVNFLFADGHAKTVDKNEMVNYYTPQIYSTNPVMVGSACDASGQFYYKLR